MNQVCVMNSGNAGQGIIISTINNIRDSQTSKLIGAPVESGSMVFDNKVIMPRKVDVNGIVSFVSRTNGDRDPQAIFDAVEKMFSERSYNTFTIVSKSKVISNMICETCEITDTTDKYDAVEIALTFKELLVADASWRSKRIDSASSGDDNDTTSSGTKTASRL